MNYSCSPGRFVRKIFERDRDVFRLKCLDFKVKTRDSPPSDNEKKKHIKIRTLCIQFFVKLSQCTPFFLVYLDVVLICLDFKVKTRDLTLSDIKNDF